MTQNNDDKSKAAREKTLNPDGTQSNEQKAKAENEVGRNKRKVERDSAQWSSPEEKTLSGQEVFPQEKVVPSTPNPADDPELQNTRYSPNFKR